MSDAAIDAVDHAALKSADTETLRAAIRAGRYRRHTAGLATGRLQANLAIMPERVALDFFRYCQRNPKPCPLVGVTDTGDPRLLTLGSDLDIRTDAPAYDVFENGERVATVPDIRELWRDDLVWLRHRFARSPSEQRTGGGGGRHAPLLCADGNATVRCSSAPPSRRSRRGRFRCGCYVVSMRPIAERALRAERWRSVPLQPRSRRRPSTWAIPPP